MATFDFHRPPGLRENNRNPAHTDSRSDWVLIVGYGGIREVNGLKTGLAICRSGSVSNPGCLWLNMP